MGIKLSDKKYHILKNFLSVLTIHVFILSVLQIL